MSLADDPLVKAIDAVLLASMKVGEVCRGLTNEDGEILVLLVHNLYCPEPMDVCHVELLFRDPVIALQIGRVGPPRHE